MKKLSCGIIITDGKNILGGHPSNRNHDLYDIPKGRQEQGETFVETAIRETMEETGLKINKYKLIDLGNFEYITTKDLHLFKLEVKQMPDISKLKCNSYFEINGKKVPEFDKYKIIPIDNLDQFQSSMAKVLKGIFSVSN